MLVAFAGAGLTQLTGILYFDGIRNLVQEFREVEHVNEVLTMHMGPDFILLNLTVNFADETTALELETIISSTDKKIRTDYPTVKCVFVEAEKRRAPG